MKDYSLNLEERKDFVLGYDVTDDGMIVVNYAKGKPWIIPYNKENEQILLVKMEEQLGNSSSYEKKLTSKFVKNVTLGGILFVLGFIPAVRVFMGETTQYLNYVSYALIGSSIIPTFNAIKNRIKLNDLKKNIMFLNMKEKLNDSIRSDQNTLVNVSNKTKAVITEFPKDRELFNVNSFNYVPFRDLEQIIENDERNQQFGFNYESKEEPPKGIIRVKSRQ